MFVLFSLVVQIQKELLCGLKLVLLLANILKRNDSSNNKCR